jgi:hypothetical protein
MQPIPVLVGGWHLQRAETKAQPRSRPDPRMKRREVADSGIEIGVEETMQVTTIKYGQKVMKSIN